MDIYLKKNCGQVSKYTKICYKTKQKMCASTRVPSSRGTEREKPQGTLLLFQWQVGIIT